VESGNFDLRLVPALAAVYRSLVHGMGEKRATRERSGHQHFAHLGVNLNEGMHLVACQLYDFARLPDTKAHQRGTTEDHADVTRELIGADNGD